MRNIARIAVALVVLADTGSAGQKSTESARTTSIGADDVRPLWDLLWPHLPPELIDHPDDQFDATWRAWVHRHDADIRSRVARGDEDSLVNFWLFGTSFTDLPPARPLDVEANGDGATLAQVADRRLDDLLERLARPGSNTRLRWAGELLRSRGIDPGAPDGRARVRTFLTGIGSRMVADNARYDRALEAARATGDPVAWIAATASLYRDRGLSSDTSMLSSFAIDATLERLVAEGTLETRPIRRVAIVGPGLDVFNKADGHDFYPIQSIQPFALIDSLVRLGLSNIGDLSVTTFDVSASVNRHLTDAAARARAGDSYVVHLALGDADAWHAELLEYLAHAGSRIGQDVEPARAPDAAGRVRVRAVRVRPDVVRTILPHDLNIVGQRLVLGEGERFDLVVATNVFVYYARLEQALAVANLGSMLRSGGTLLANQGVLPVVPMAPTFDQHTVVFSERQSDHVFRYRRE